MLCYCYIWPAGCHMRVHYLVRNRLHLQFAVSPARALSQDHRRSHL